MEELRGSVRAQRKEESQEKLGGGSDFGSESRRLGEVGQLD